MAGSLTDDALAIWQAGTDSVRGKELVQRSFSIANHRLEIADQAVVNLKDIDRILVLGGGKAAAAMLSGLQAFFEAHLPSRIQVTGWLHAPKGTFETEFGDESQSAVRIYPARDAGSNEPTEYGVEGSREMLRLATGADARTLVLCLISGGASALMPLPVAGLSLADKLSAIRYLSDHGAGIESMNEVRRCLSQIKGGGLAIACKQAHQVVALIISDVLGDPLHLIGSGPTVIEPYPSPARALSILQEWDPGRSIPKPIYETLTRLDEVHSAAGGRRSLKSLFRRSLPGVSTAHKTTNILLANNATAVDAAGVAAVDRGYAYWMESSSRGEGAVLDVAHKLLRGIEVALRDGQPDCLISGGEPTVVLPTNELRGVGGRNQQLALEVMRLMQSHSIERLRTAQGISIVCGGTDGEDGPTDAAGAIVSESTMARAVSLGLNLSDYAARCDGYHFFEQVGGLMKTGPTGTNVCDLRVALIASAAN